MTECVAIVGAGRIGAGLGGALAAAGFDVTLLVRSTRPAPSGAGLCVGVERWAAPVRAARVILIATPDSTIGEVAQVLSGMDAIGEGHSVLHLSGLLDRDALAPLRSCGAALGSLHPLQAIASAATAAERLRGAYAAVEGDQRAVAAGTRLARGLGMHPVPIPSGAKAGYHAAATVASNYAVVLFDLARGIAERAGVPAATAAAMYIPLLRGTVENLQMGAAAALTGAIRRGDVMTVRAHLAILTPGERRIYAGLGLEALRLARAAGLSEAAAAEVGAALETAAREV